MVKGYFRHWFAHSLAGAILFDMPVSLLVTWLVTVLAARYMKSGWKPDWKPNEWRKKFGIWVLSAFVGIISHLALDLPAHDTNLLLYPWYDNVQWLPEWWYMPWYTMQLPPALGYSYTFGPHTVAWIILSVSGTIMFYRFVFQSIKAGSIKEK
jgi:hypothetical protein